jgi:alpha-D-xyloside xylohydrolase
MPYIYAQAKLCSEKGYPMLRTLFFERPDDPNAWLVEDEYFFGEDILVAPLIKEAPSRNVYAPPGVWIDYQTDRVYEGGRWHHIESQEIPAIVLVKDGTVLPHVQLAQSTDQIDWAEVELVVFNTEPSEAHGLICFPGDDVLRTLEVDCGNDTLSLVGNELEVGVSWTIYRGPANSGLK